MKLLDFLFALSLWHNSVGFNIDQNNLVTQFTIPEKDSLFGYSVALKKTKDMELIVGAPFYNKKEGAVYSCKLSSKTCQLLQDYSVSDASSPEQRSKELMGVTLTNNEEHVLAGASRWWIKSYGTQYYRGRVSVFKKDGSIEYGTVPCENESYGNLAYGYCEAGMSSSSSKFEGLPFFAVGAPGSVNFQGALFTLYYKNGATRVSRTPEDRLKINSYMGYSVTTGKFSNPSESGYVTDLAGGAPRGSELQGKVIIYKVMSSLRVSTLLTIENPTDQVGSYFGASVAAVDLDNDGKDDLLIGSPYYAKIQDEGRVFVYINRHGSKFNGFDRTLTLEGDNEHNARFGSSIANIGDINNDGYKDIAIGAPYGGPDGNGVVYIYNGGQSGLRHDKPQRIFASDMPSLGKGFGISIAGGIDVDDNEYPDIAVGASGSSNAYIIKTKPVIKLTSVLSSSVNAVPSIKNDKFKCKNPARNNHNCLTLSIDLSYTGLGTPDNLTVETTIELDKNKLSKRVEEEHTEKTTIIVNKTLSKNVAESIDVPLAVLLSVDGDVISPIEFSAKYKIYVNPKDCIYTPCATLDKFDGSIRDSHQITFLKNCKSETTCKPDLHVTNSIVLPRNPNLAKKEVLYGVVYYVDLLAHVNNTGEAAYQSAMKLNFSSELQFIGVEVDKKAVDSRKLIPLNSEENQLQFPLANPISTNQSVSVLIRFSVLNDRPIKSQYVFSSEATAFGEDKNLKNNKDSKSIDVKIESCVGLASNAKPSKLQYRLDAPVPPPPSSNTTLRNESVKVDVIGNEVIYTFYVQNNGKLPVEKLQADINVNVLKDELDFIYVVYVEVDGVACKKSQFNPLGYVTKYDKEETTNNKNKQGSYLRRRRGADAVNQDDDIDKSKIVTCGRQGTCKTYSCDINRIEAKKGAIITMVTRLWDHNLPKINAMGVETTMKVKFSGFNKGFYKQRDGCTMTTDVRISLRPGSVESKKKPIPWWVLVLAIVGALLLLAIAVAILYKVGFFKRNRKIKEITGPTDGGNEAHNPNAEYDDEDDE